MQKNSIQLNSTSSLGMRHQDDFHTGRLICWSSALVALTLWGTAQFFNRQNLRWHHQHSYEQQHKVANDDEAAFPEAAAIFRRVAAQRHQREAQVR